MSQISTQF